MPRKVSNVARPVRAGNRGGDADKQDIQQVMPLGAVYPRVFDGIEIIREVRRLQFRHQHALREKKKDPSPESVRCASLPYGKTNANDYFKLSCDGCGD